jgi:preprotein translocase subunit YajC
MDEGGGFPIMIVFLVLIFAMLYFLMIRPQRRKQSEHKQLIEELRRGDKVITIGGIYGEIDSVGEHEVTLKVEGGGKLKLLKSSIMGKQQSE